MGSVFQVVFYLLAAALLGAAAYFYSTDESDRAFASAVLAACSFFLGLRFRLKKFIADNVGGNDENDETPASG
jgi:hypothetical protein